MCADKNEIHYTFSSPAERIVLSKQLNEISGICWMNENEIACVQDELKFIYILSSKTGNIIKQYNFNIAGDYEAITKSDSCIYLLRSDGMLTEVKSLNNDNPKGKDYILKLLTTNNEGLCYDKTNNRLLIAAKNKVNGNNQYDQKRLVYAFNLKTKLLEEKPVFTIDEREILERALEQKLVVIDKKDRKKKADNIVRFNPSEIGINPIDGEIYMLSSNAKMLIIVNAKGKIKQIEKLDPIIFNKPEGITFAPNGDLFISNEAQNKQATLLRFNYTK
jgi:hypothetical protein